MLKSSNVHRLPRVPSLSWDDCRLLVESVVDYAIFMLDAEGRVATWNLGAEKIKGYQASEIIGHHFSVFFPPEDIADGKPQRELEAAQAQGRTEDEGWRIRKDGSRFWASVIVTALRDEHGNLRGFGKITRDLTARRAAEERVRQAEQRFHHLVDAVIDYAIYMLDPTGHVSTWNSGAERLKGYAPDEIVGKHFSIFYTPDDRRAGRPERILDIVRREGRYEEESWRVRKDGSRFWANIVLTALRDEHGALLGFAKVTRDLTQRRLAEEELRQSEERFRLLVETVSDYAIYMLDPAGVVTTWNLGAERLKGYRADEIIGRNFAAFFPEDDVTNGKPARELALARAQGRFEDEGWRVRKDGSRFWANAVVTALHNAQGTLIGFAKITRDLTAKHEAQEAERQLLREQTAREVAEQSEHQLRDSEERYRSLSQRLEIVLEGVTDGITVQDRSGALLFANSAAARICGFDSVEALMACSPAEIVARFEILDEHGNPFRPEDFPGRRVLSGQHSSSAVLHVRERATGRTWWSSVRAGAVLADDGSAHLAVNIWHDVTAERREEQQAKYLADATSALASSLENTEMLSTLARTLVPGLADWCSIFLAEGEELRSVAIAHADAAKLEAAHEYQRKFPPKAQQRRGVWNVFRTGELEVHNDITDEMLAAASQDDEHLAALRAVGMKAIVLAPVVIRGCIVGVLSLVSAESNRRFEASDISLIQELSRRAAAALDNARLYAQAQEAAAVADRANRAKDEFLATVSHELRTPLNAIVGWSTLLKGRVTDPALAKPIDVIYRNAQAQAQIIDDILDVSRVITGSLRIEAKPADFVTIARDAIEVVRPAATAKKIALEFAPADEFCLLIADPERLQQVVWNLVSNSVKFTPAGGKVRVEVHQDGSRAVLSVTDTGKGIDPAFLPFVFERFRQADSSITRRTGGLGLGLALVRHIVELHGGEVSAHSEGVGQGSTFVVRVPIRAVVPRAQSDPSAPEEPTPPAPSLAGLLSGVRILVVDDELDARELISTVLSEAGAIVEVLSSAAEGFAAFKRFRPDVIVSDIGMPDEDGLSFIRRIRALPASEGCATPAIALTAFAREEDGRRAVQAGYTEHLAKPATPDALVSLVANLVPTAKR